MGGKSKRLYGNDGLKRVKDTLHEFYDLNHNMPKDLKLPITCEYYYIFCCAHSVPDELLISGFPTYCPQHRGYSWAARGYSWLEGCSQNPWSGVQTPQVPECSSVVGGWGPTCPIRVHLGVDIPGNRHGTIIRTLKTIQPSRDRTPGIGQHQPNQLVINSHHSPCQLLAEGGTWWQDSSNYGKS